MSQEPLGWTWSTHVIPSVELSYNEIINKDHRWFRVTANVLLVDSALMDDFSYVQTQGVRL